MSELSVVIPVYNEEAFIPMLIHDWVDAFNALHITYTLICINDGSKDNTAVILNEFASSNKNILVIEQNNTGHGPAIMRGYKTALQSEWVFQVDGDHQYSAKTFAKFWNNRKDYDLLIGERMYKNESVFRKIVSAVARFSVLTVCGTSLKDVNCPYRLIRASVLEKAIAAIPSKSFAPNLMMSIFFLVKKGKIYVAPIPRSDIPSKRSGLNIYMLKGAVKSFYQIVNFRLKL
ncbi:MAG: glycosyltransferase family 2 protein [Agriterribacter sp.]